MVPTRYLRFTVPRHMKTVHDTPEIIGQCHVGLDARNPATPDEFYRDVIGLQLVGAVNPDGPHRNWAGRA